MLFKTEIMKLRCGKGCNPTVYCLCLAVLLALPMTLWGQDTTVQPPSPSVESEVGEKKADVEQEAREEAARKDEEIKQVIGYGLDSDLVTVIKTLLRETSRLPTEDDQFSLFIKETPYNAAIYDRIQKGFSSSELETEAIQFFMLQKWIEPAAYVTGILEHSLAGDNVDNNLLLVALAYLRTLKVKSSEEPVLGLLSNENPQIVEQSLVTLGKIGSDTSAALILKLLEDEADSFTEFTDREREVLRVAGIAALGELSYLPAAEYFLAILKNAKSNEQEYSNSEWGSAAKALGQMGRLEAVSLILEKFRSGNTQERYQSLIALGSFPLQAEFENIILQGLQEAYWKTREQAAKAAGELQIQSAIPSLVYKIAKDSVLGVRRAAIQSLRQMGDSGNSALQQMMQNPDVREGQRLDVLKTLIRAQDESAVGIFRQLLSDKDNKFGLSHKSLFRVAISDPWAALDFVYKEMLLDSDQKIRQGALYAISKERIVGLQGDVKDLAENAADSVTRQAAKSALGALGALGALSASDS